MATLREVVKGMLSGDSQLAAILPGGIFDAEDFEQDGGGSNQAPRQADAVRINPFATIRWRASASYQTNVPNALGAERGFLEVYFYQDVGYEAIDRAASRVKALLNDKYPATDDRQIAHLLYAFTSDELTAPEFEGAPCMFSRYQVIHIR